MTRKQGVKGIKKRWIIIALLAALAGGILVSADRIKDAYVKSKLDPRAELQDSISKTTAVKNYRYAMKSEFTVNGRGEVISEVQGEKNHDNTHIKGEMVNTSVDIYYIDRTIYNYDSFAGKWLVIESGTSNSEELLISELNPLSNFRFKHINQVEKQGFEPIDGADCLVVTGNPTVEAQLLETMWKDVSYRFWIDYKKNLIRQAVLTATNKKNLNTRLKLEVKLKDFDRNIEIKPPDLSKSKN